MFYLSALRNDIVTIFVILLAFGNACRATVNNPGSSSHTIYQDPTKPTVARVNDLLSRMSFEEKLAQTRNLGGILSTNATYNATMVDTFNSPYGGGSICKYSSYITVKSAGKTDKLKPMAITQILHASWLRS